MNTKTIVFAALIAAMILPFSGMQSVSAEAENLPDEAELTGDYLPEGTVLVNGNADWDKEHDEISMNLPIVVIPEVIKIGESEEELPVVEASRSRATPTPDNGNNLPVEVPVDQSESEL